jgi:hypothetical protein
MAMLLKPVRVKTETLEQLNELLDIKGQDQSKIKDEISEKISESIYKIWLKFCRSDTAFIYIDDTPLEVEPKKERKEFLKELTGHFGPYKVTKTCKSWVGISEGIYKLDDTDMLVPITWFTETKTEKNTTNFVLIVLLVILSLLQSGFLLFLL